MWPEQGSFHTSMKNQLKTLILLGALSAVLVAIGGALGEAYLYGALGLALLMNVGAYFWSDRIVLAMHRAREIDAASAPRLHAIVAELAQRAGLPKPRVFVIHDAQPNAFATGRNPERGVVAVTQGIMQLLDERELRAVLAHEMAHIKNRDVLVATIAAAIAAAVTYLAHAAQFAAIFGGHRDDEEGGSVFGQLALAIVAPIAATLIQLGVSRSREFLADEAGAKLSGDPLALASALEKLDYAAQRVPTHAADPATASLFIVNPFAGSGRTLLKLFSTHPDTKARVERLVALAGNRHTGAPGTGRFAYGS
jgi:heat shock protein HtpX